jgi:hypothetical protein
MEDQETIRKERDLAAMLEFHFKGHPGVKHQDFERVLKEFVDVTVSELHKVVKFTSDQLGSWEAEWLFSSLDSPNTVAEAEVTGWLMVSRACTNALVERVPQLRGEIDRQQKLISVRHTIERRIDYNKTRWFQRLTTYLLSRISIQLNRIGFQKMANGLYVRSLYPPGTVGRSKDGA